MGEFLKFVWEVAFCWMPRLQLCRVSHRGVKFRRGGKVKVIEPGLFWLWPLFEEVELLPVVPQTVRLPWQTIMSAGQRPKPTHLRAALVYEIDDIEAAVAGTWELDELVSDCAASAVVNAVSEREVSTFRRELTTKVRKELTSATRKALRPYGVRVRWCRVADYGVGPAYRVIGEGAVVPLEDDD